MNETPLKPKDYSRPTSARRVAKPKHPKGFGTEKEHRKKGTWFEVMCHGKPVKVAGPRVRYEKVCH